MTIVYKTANTAVSAAQENKKPSFQDEYQ